MNFIISFVRNIVGKLEITKYIFTKDIKADIT
jgi:hypothetical protein